MAAEPVCVRNGPNRQRGNAVVDNRVGQARASRSLVRRTAVNAMETDG